MNVEFVDSHTEGEPTRAILSGFPDLQGATLAEKAQDFRERWLDFRNGVLLEPRGSDVLVGALILPPSAEGRLADVIFFNNKAVLGMCGHGTLGVAETLRERRGLSPGQYRIGTPVGEVTIDLLPVGAAVENVPAFVFRRDVEVSGFEIPIVGDIAWGGNWFFLTHSTPVPVALENHRQLSDYTIALMAALAEQGITGENGGEIDHVEVFAEPTRADCDSKNFVMCPGGAFDRSPCGTGTSAKLALLAAQGKLGPGQAWHQESIIGSSFTGSYRMDGDKLIPRIEGRAYLTAFGTLLCDEKDPFKTGIVF